MEKIGIVGCGWLGLPLAESLIARGYAVCGTTTTESKLEILRGKGIEAYLLNFDPIPQELPPAELFACKTVIINIPPRRRPDIEVFHPQQIASFIEACKAGSVGNVVFVSSTSVYPESAGYADENNNLMPDKESGKALLIAEKMLFESGMQCTSIRMGGLIAEDRHPSRFLKDKTLQKDGNSPVNLIHREDAVESVIHIIVNKLWGQIFNACCPEHPTRADFYAQAAKSAGLPCPLFPESKTAAQHKIVSSQKIIDSGFAFTYKSPMEML